jgi:prepilin-type N-terminal cleavage/methylation domain-containing protein
MLQKLRGNSKGFTLIELMIVIAIIGILAAIAIPNFIAYRNKAYCSAAESDANNLAAALADYYSVPSHTGFQAGAVGNPTDWVGLGISGTNTATLSGTIDNIGISVIDGSNRCPTDYITSQTDWTDTGTVKVFTKNM